MKVGIGAPLIHCVTLLNISELEVGFKSICLSMSKISPPVYDPYCSQSEIWFHICVHSFTCYSCNITYEFSWNGDFVTVTLQNVKLVRILLTIINISNDFLSIKCNF